MAKRSKFRIFLAYAQAILLIMIISSGMLFMHKHTTSTGQIIVHFHPYNLKTDPDGTKHRHTDNEIQFLNVVFQGSYLQVDAIVLGNPVIVEYREIPVILTHAGPSHKYDTGYYLRGPPASI